MNKTLKVTFSVEVHLLTVGVEDKEISDEVMAEIKDYAFNVVAAGEVAMRAYTAQDGSLWYFRSVGNGLMTTEVHLAQTKV